MKKIALIILSVFLLYGTIYADISGVPIVDQDYYEIVFGERYICGPTTVSEVVGYWDANGYPDLVNGELSGDIPDNSQTMEDLMEEMIFTWTGWIPGLGNYPEDLSQGIRDYFSSAGYNVEVVLGERGRASWGEATAEIDAGRPFILLRWDIPHYVVVTGYNSNPREIDVLYGHIPYERTWNVYSLRLSDLQTIFIRPQGATPLPPPNPEDEPWYDDVMEWCEVNGWELEPAD